MQSRLCVQLRMVQFTWHAGSSCCISRACSPPAHSLRDTLKLVSSTDVKIDVTKPRWPVSAYREALNGHHPISLTESSSNLVEGFNVAAK